jgi:hypothetical protein
MREVHTIPHTSSDLYACRVSVAKERGHLLAFQSKGFRDLLGTIFDQAARIVMASRAVDRDHEEGAKDRLVDVHKKLTFRPRTSYSERASSYHRYFNHGARSPMSLLYTNQISRTVPDIQIANGPAKLLLHYSSRVAAPPRTRPLRKHRQSHPHKARSLYDCRNRNISLDPLAS